jgi:hypothetical protein
MDIYRCAGLSGGMLLIVASLLVPKGFLTPAYSFALAPFVSLYCYFMWVREVRNPAYRLLYMYLLCPIFVIPLFVIPMLIPMDDRVGLSVMAAFVLGIFINLLIFGKRALPKQIQDDSTSIH